MTNTDKGLNNGSGLLLLLALLILLGIILTPIVLSFAWFVVLLILNTCAQLFDAAG